jgi:hypothetical protein
MATFRYCDCYDQDLTRLLRDNWRLKEQAASSAIALECYIDNTVEKYHDKGDKSEEMPRVSVHEIGNDFQAFYKCIHQIYFAL